ncbi:hypothetical protein RB195_020034 [Necator americanus]|uniref:Uncharacterized protein n=1 Tax=Necator americanus TaxID=51031 RepID=A0ABR1CHI1_NECAM
MLASEAAIEDRMMQAMKKYHQHVTLEELVEYGKEPESDVCGGEGFSASLTIACAPTSNYEEEVEAFYMDLEKFHGAEHTFYKVIIGVLNARIDPRRTPEELHFGTHTL